MMTLEERRSAVLKVLDKMQAPEDFKSTARQAATVGELNAVCAAAQAAIGDDLTALADALQKLGAPSEAARARAEGRLALAPWEQMRRAVEARKEN